MLKDKFFGDKEACKFWENIFSMAAAATLVMVFFGERNFGAMIFTLIFVGIGWKANRKAGGEKDGE